MSVVNHHFYDKKYLDAIEKLRATLKRPQFHGVAFRRALLSGLESCEIERRKQLDLQSVKIDAGTQINMDSLGHISKEEKKLSKLQIEKQNK